jgi:hypothetical protein
MEKDRDQLTPSEPEDRAKLQPRRSVAREVTGLLDQSAGPGPGSSGADPRAAEEVAGPEAEKYR